MNKYVFLIISFVLEFLFLNVLPFEYQQILYIQPMFIITTIFLIYSLFDSNRKYYQVILFFSIIYGSLFLNNILLGVFLLLIVSFISKIYHKYIHLNIFTIILGIIVIILIYDSVFYIILNISQVSIFSFNVLLYKITHSLIINLVYASLIYKFYIKKVLKPLYS